MKQFGSGRHYDIAALDLGGHDVESVIASARAKDDALSKFLLAEIYYRNCWATFEAMDLYLEAARQAQHSPLYWETLGDRAYAIYFIDLAVYAYQNMGAQGQAKLAIAHAAQSDHDNAAKVRRQALKRNPFDLELLSGLRESLEKLGENAELNDVEQLISQLTEDPSRKASPVTFSFDPPYPTFNKESSVMVGSTEVFEHSHFLRR